MAGISDAEKLGMAALIASIQDPKKKKKVPLPRPRPAGLGKKSKKVIPADVESGIVSEGDANDELMIENMKNMRNGGTVDGAAIRGKTKGKIC
jgi:hypothetical protein